MPKGVKPYSVKSRGDGLTLKQRYEQFRQAKADAVLEIEQHDPKMAASARRLLFVSAGALSRAKQRSTNNKPEYPEQEHKMFKSDRSNPHRSSEADSNTHEIKAWKPMVFGVGVWAITGAISMSFAQMRDPDFKYLAQDTPSFQQMHNEAVAYDYIRVAEIGANIDINDVFLDSKLQNMQTRLNFMLDEMITDHPEVYEDTIFEVMQEARREAKSGLWSQQALDAYADATLQMDISISNMGHAAIENITKSENVTHFEADRMAAVTLAYTLADMAGDPKDEIHDGLRQIAERHQGNFASLSTPLSKVLSVQAPDQPTDAVMVSNPFSMPDVENAVYLEDAPDHS